MKKKEVSLEIFQESVLPMLQKKLAGDAAFDIQKAIDDHYTIYEGEGEKKTPVIFTVAVNKVAPGPTEDEIKARVEKEVDDRIKSLNIIHSTAKRIGQPGSENGEFTIPATVRRYGQPKNFIREKIGKYDRVERAYRFGMWAMACLGNENAKAFCDGQGISVKLHQTNVNTTGGFLVPEEFGADLIDLRLEYGAFRRNARIEPMMSDTKTVPRRTGGLTAYFVAEGAAGTESTKGWDQVRLVAKDLMVISRMTNQLSEDAGINIGDDLAGEIGYSFALKEDQCGFIGDGSATYGGIVGVSTALSTLNGTDDGGGIVVAAGNLFSEFVLADFHRTIARTPTYARKGAKWYASPNFHDSVMQARLTAAGGNTVANLQQGGGAVPMFLGYPVELVEVMPTADVNSQVACLFGDLTKAARFGDRQQDMIDFSTQASVGGQSLWERNEIGIRGTQRFDIVVHDIGTTTVAGPMVGLMSASS